MRLGRSHKMDLKVKNNNHKTSEKQQKKALKRVNKDELGLHKDGGLDKKKILDRGPEGMR